MITWSDVMPCCHMNADGVALEKKQFSVRYQVPLFLSTRVAMLYDRLGQRLRRTSNIPLRGVSLTFIDQTDPLAPTLPSFAAVERFDNNMLGLDCMLCRSAIHGLRAREVFKVIGPIQPKWTWSPRTFLWDTVTRVSEGQANIRYSQRGMDHLACMSDQNGAQVRVTEARMWCFPIRSGRRTHSHK